VDRSRREEHQEEILAGDQRLGGFQPLSHRGVQAAVQ